MYRARVIPCLLLKNSGLVKTVGFKAPTYVGDPINTIKIFNEKEVDELIFLDIEASARGRGPLYDRIFEFAGECFMPFCYGGGIRNCGDIGKILSLGAEKVSINTQAVANPAFIAEAAREFGSQSIVVTMDVKYNLFGQPQVFVHTKKTCLRMDPVQYAKKMEDCGAGELMIYSVDRDGTMQGYDINLLRKITSAVSIPVIACGGAGSARDLHKAVIAGGASAAAAGSMFVFYGRHRAVLINYPAEEELAVLFGDGIGINIQTAAAL